MAQHLPVQSPVLRHPRANNPGDLLGPRSSPNVCVETTNLALATSYRLIKIAHFLALRLELGTLLQPPNCEQYCSADLTPCCNNVYYRTILMYPSVLYRCWDK